MRAGIFDSGVGGLTVLKSLLENKLFEEIIYYGDTARVPYGTKDKNTIIRYSLDALEFFKNFDIDILIVACNTASAYALEELRMNADFEVVGVIEAGILSLQHSNIPQEENILVLGTHATVNSGQYQEGLKKLGFSNITSQAASLFVPIVEEGLFEGIVTQTVIRHYFDAIKSDPKAVILGCTHFPLIQQAIQEYFPQALTIHSGDAIVEHLKQTHQINTNFTKTDIKFFATENPDKLKKTAKEWLKDLL
jgi:glutamate racemase